MGTTVTLNLPDELYEQANQWATMTQQNLAETLTHVLSLTLMPITTIPEFQKPMASLSDEAVLEQTKIQMTPEQGKRLTYLLAQQREGALTVAEQPELITLAQLYQTLWVRQSEALAEAVKRGLRTPLTL